MASHGVPKSARDRTQEQITLDRDKIEKYRALEDRYRKQAASNTYDDETLQLTTKLLRINPEYYTVWNGRRRCLVSGELSTNSTQTHTSATQNEAPQKSGGTHEQLTQSSEQAQAASDATETTDNGVKEERIRSELMFTVPLLMQYPKCYWIWNYRIWVLEKATELLETAAARTIWQEELGLTEKMLNRDKRNFHAWSYRRYVVSQLESSELNGKSLAEPEFEYTTRMINQNLSNFSAWHNRAKLIPRMLDERKADAAARKEFLGKEFEMVDGALNVGPEDQSLWYYHQYLVSSVTQKDVPDSFVPDLTNDERVAILNREIEFIQELLEDYTDIKWIYEALLQYSMAISQIQGHAPQTETATLSKWLTQIKSLDQQRSQRWNDLGRELQLA